MQRVERPRQKRNREPEILEFVEVDVLQGRVQEEREARPVHRASAEAIPRVEHDGNHSAHERDRLKQQESQNTRDEREEAAPESLAEGQWRPAPEDALPVGPHRNEIGIAY